MANEGAWLARLATWIAAGDDRYSNEPLVCVALILPTAGVGLVTISAFDNAYTNWSWIGPLLIGFGCLAAGAWAFTAMRWRRKMRAGTLGKGVWPTLGIGSAAVAIALASLAWLI